MSGILQFNCYNIFFMFSSFGVLYFVVVFVSIVCGKYVAKLDYEYEKKLEEVGERIQILRQEYKLFCEAKDEEYKTKTSKHFKNSELQFSGLSEYIQCELNQDYADYSSTIENIENNVKKIIFNEIIVQEENANNDV